MHNEDAAEHVAPAQATAGHGDEQPGVPRRLVLGAGAATGGVVLLTGCSTYGQSPGEAEGVQNPIPVEPPAPATPGGPATPGTPGPGVSPKRSAAAGAGAANALAKATDIPVGSGKIFAAQKVVVTQPRQGTFVAFSTTCTHQGCAVETIANGEIVCPCHDSKFGVADGSVKGGPAPRPLAKVAIKVVNGSIVLGA